MPRLTSERPSASVATTLLSLTPTVTAHPVPQKRHGAFDHLSRVPSTAGACASAIGMSASAAVPAAPRFRKSRREMVIVSSSFRSDRTSCAWRPRQQLVHPDEEAVAANDGDRDRRRHHDSEEQKASPLFVAGRGL